MYRSFWSIVRLTLISAQVTCGSELYVVVEPWNRLWLQIADDIDFSQFSKTLVKIAFVLTQRCFSRGMTRPFFSRERISDFDNFDRHATEALDRAQTRLQEGYAIDFQVRSLSAWYLAFLNIQLLFPPGRSATFHPRLCFRVPARAWRMLSICGSAIPLLFFFSKILGWIYLSCWYIRQCFCWRTNHMCFTVTVWG